MSVTLAPLRPETFADRHRRLGCVPLERIWLDDALDGGDVLPGFRVTPRDLFEQAGHRRGRPSALATP